MTLVGVSFFLLRPMPALLNKKKLDFICIKDRRPGCLLLLKLCHR